MSEYSPQPKGDEVEIYLESDGEIDKVIKQSSNIVLGAENRVLDS